MSMNWVLAAAALVGAIHGSETAESNTYLRLAHRIAGYAGYTPGQRRKIDFDIIDEAGRDTYPGYKTIQILSNAQGVFDLSIEINSGRVFDFNRCLVFKYYFIAGSSSRLLTKPGLDSDRRVMRDHGCARYRILRRRGDEAR